MIGIGDFIASFKHLAGEHDQDTHGRGSGGEDWSEYDREVEEGHRKYAEKVAEFHKEADKRGFKKSAVDDSVYKKHTYGDEDQYSSQVAVRYQKQTDDYRVSTLSKFPTPLGGNSIGNRNLFTSSSIDEALNRASAKFEEMKKYDQERPLNG